MYVNCPRRYTIPLYNRAVFPLLLYSRLLQTAVSQYLLDPTHRLHIPVQQFPPFQSPLQHSLETHLPLQMAFFLYEIPRPDTRFYTRRPPRLVHIPRPAYIPPLHTPPILHNMYLNTFQSFFLFSYYFYHTIQMSFSFSFYLCLSDILPFHNSMAQISPCLFHTTRNKLNLITNIYTHA